MTASCRLRWMSADRPGTIARPITDPVVLRTPSSMWTVPSPPPMNQASTRAPESVHDLVHQRLERFKSTGPDRILDHPGHHFPENGAEDRPRAVHVDLVDLGDGRELRCLVLHRHRREQIGIGGEEGAAVD